MVPDTFLLWGNLYREYQEHDGAVGGATLYTQYDYSDGATGGVAAFVRLADVVYPNGRAVGYNYASGVDAVMSRLSSIFDDFDADGVLDSGETVDAAYKYLGLGQIVEEDDEGARLIYLGEAHGLENNVIGLDRFGRVIQQLWQDGTYLNEIDCYTYAYDRAGNVTDRVNNMDLVLTDHYVYDDLDRLIEWDEGWPLVQQKVWSLDSLGNNISTTTGGTYDAANEETSIAGSSVTPAYDAAGNMTVLSSGDTAKYDAWNRLVEVDASNSEEEITSTYAYDGAGRRVRETVETRYIQHPMVSLDQHDDYYVGQQVVETRGGDGDVEYQNLWSPRYIDAMILRDTYSGGDLVLADRVFYLSDANYNVTGLMKYNGDYGEWDIVERYSYTPYGVVTYRDHYWDEAEDQTVSAYANTTLYAGRTLDLSTGLYYNRARYYDATLERFINRYPVGYRRGINLYRYVGDSPVVYIDPSGLGEVCGFYVWLYAGSWCVDQSVYDAATGAAGDDYLVSVAERFLR